MGSFIVLSLQQLINNYPNRRRFFMVYSNTKYYLVALLLSMPCTSHAWSVEKKMTHMHHIVNNFFDTMASLAEQADQALEAALDGRISDLKGALIDHADKVVITFHQVKLGEADSVEASMSPEENKLMVQIPDSTIGIWAHKGYLVIDVERKIETNITNKFTRVSKESYLQTVTGQCKLNESVVNYNKTDQTLVVTLPKDSKALDKVKVPVQIVE
jgi:hypothetical protein